MGSERFLTLNISSADLGSWAETILGAPVRHSFKTSLGTYFVNVAQVDFETNRMSVEIGCLPRGTSR
jgi:hypothetical protein